MPVTWTAGLALSRITWLLALCVICHQPAILRSPRGRPYHWTCAVSWVIEHDRRGPGGRAPAAAITVHHGRPSGCLEALDACYVDVVLAIVVDGPQLARHAQGLVDLLLGEAEFAVDRLGRPVQHVFQWRDVTGDPVTQAP